MKIDLTENELITVHDYLSRILPLVNQNDIVTIKSALNKIYGKLDTSPYDGMIEGIIKNKNNIL